MITTRKVNRRITTGDFINPVYPGFPCAGLSIFIRDCRKTRGMRDYIIV